METMTLGILALTALLVSVCCLYCKKPVLSIACSALSAALTFGTGYSWQRMLTESGKDTALLGFNRYPAALIILAILLFTSLAVMILSIIRTVKK